jgi:ATP-binding cassette subfamily B protein
LATSIVYEEEEFEGQLNLATILRILSQVKPHWRWVAGFLVAVALVSVFESYATFLTKRIIDEGILAGDQGALLSIISLYGGLTLLQAAGVFAFIYLAGVLGERVQYDLRRKMFEHLQQLSLAYYDRTPVGWMIARVTSDSETISMLLTWGLLDVTWAVFNILTALIFMLYINWRLSLVVLAIIPALVLVGAQFKRKILLEFRQSRKINSKITGSFNENISGVRVTKALGREDQNSEEFTSVASSMFTASYRAAWLSALFLPAVQMISALAIGGVVWYGGLQAQTGAITIGGIQAFIGYITFILWPVQDLARVYAEMQHSIASAERVFSLIDSDPDITDRPGSYDPGSLQGDIEFENVSFAYEDGVPVLQDFNLHVRRGETIALVGPTGGGKTTIVNLLGRFYEPTSGMIRIAGKPYLDFSVRAIQSRIGVVLQDPHLFSGTIRENIRYAQLDADDESIVAAARLAGADDFIRSMEGGYEAEVGEGGNLLSVGQKQLISLARAILADPEILIMDEATSSVDTLTEAQIQKGIEALMRERTSFIIAHRLSTIKGADRIAVIEEGRILEMGGHRELLARKGKYFDLYTRQFRREIEGSGRLFALSGAD